MLLWVILDLHPPVALRVQVKPPPSFLGLRHFSPSLPTLVPSVFLNSSCPKGWDIISRCDLNLHFSSDEWCLASFRVWQPSAHRCKMSAQVLCLFLKTWLFLLVVLCYWSIFCHNIYPISGCDNQKNMTTDHIILHKILTLAFSGSCVK